MWGIAVSGYYMQQRCSWMEGEKRKELKCSKLWAQSAKKASIIKEHILLFDEDVIPRGGWDSASVHSGHGHNFLQPWWLYDVRVHRSQERTDKNKKQELHRTVYEKENVGRRLGWIGHRATHQKKFQ